jgi:hypothetical protein
MISMLIAWMITTFTILVVFAGLTAQWVAGLVFMIHFTSIAFTTIPFISREFLSMLARDGMHFHHGDTVHGVTIDEDLAGELDGEVPGAQRHEWGLETLMPSMEWAWALLDPWGME